MTLFKLSQGFNTKKKNFCLQGQGPRGGIFLQVRQHQISINLFPLKYERNIAMQRTCRRTFQLFNTVYR